MINAIIFLALNLADLFITLIIIDKGIGVEGNPVINYTGMWVKMPLACIVTLLAYEQRGLMVTLNIGFTVILTWNILVLLEVA